MNEARRLIDKLDERFQFRPGQKFLDLACGKGRHAIYMNRKGLDVIGVDLSPQNIAEAKVHENDRLHFFVHDMRDIFSHATFDYVVNLFTSFGYFDTESENEQAICATATAMKPGGYFIMDYLNPVLVKRNMVPCEERNIDDIQFKINRRFSEGYFLKDIEFEVEEKTFFFQEKVQAIGKKEFFKYFQKAGLVIEEVYGDYQLNEFDENLSSRMIFVLKKDKLA